MAQLDQFLKVMLQENGSEFLLAPDTEPRLRNGRRSSALIARKLTAPQIRFLLKEIVSPGDARSLEARDGGDIFYEVPGVGSVFVTISGWNGETTASFHAAGAREPGALPSDFESRPAPELAPPSPRAPEPRVAQRAPEPEPPASGRWVAGELEIHKMFRLMVKLKASDLHLCIGERPMIRKDGDIQRLGHLEPLTPKAIAELVYPITPDHAKELFEKERDADFAFELPGVSRFRGNLFTDRFGMGAVFRTIPTVIPSADELGLSPSIQNLCYLSKGLVLVTGPTGSGKSTTLASLVDLVNTKRQDHIITIEDPIEFVHPNKSCLVNQREVGQHTESFKRALRAALREDPDVVLVGEMRDLETVAIAIETAETGHLVFGTLHTSTAYSTIDRIIDQFPPDQQEQIRVMLSESLKAVISQTLCKKIGGGRVAAQEVLLVNAAISNLIREGKTFQIPSIMQTQRKAGMVVMNDALMDLVQRKLVDVKEAYIKAIDKNNFINMAKAAGHTLDFLRTDAAP